MTARECWNCGRPAEADFCLDCEHGLVATQNGGASATPSSTPSSPRPRPPVEAAALEELVDPNLRFPGISHPEALAAEIVDAPLVVANLIEAGSVGTVAALPESHKSFLATEIAHKVAGGGGRVLGELEIRKGGSVGYWWQDDSEANELRRIQAYAGRHGYTGGLPIRWHLNEGLRLPEHLDALRVEVEQQQQVLVVLDSLYNFLGGVALKDEDVALVYAAIKTQVCDPTGCAVLIVDHAAWPTEGNRGQRRAYGSVFKAAAIRWGVYIERDGDKLWVEARGNNIAGFKRRLAVWDEDALELRLVAEHEARNLAAEIRSFLLDHPRSTTNAVEKGVKAGRKAVIETLKASAEFRFDAGPNNSKLWWFSEAQNHPEPPGGPEGGEWFSRGATPVGGTTENHSATGGSHDAELLQAEADRIADEYADLGGTA